ncbi:peptidoglycan-binding domain-containing protein [Capilliphycus salinus ALCB114379]|uniref:peptidoglycan-binding domain-containing protein n=1 Tax=Capilliphycus salinus TaxID=2768948 RepID=UPI0039A71794
MSAMTNIETNGQAIATAAVIPASEPVQYAAAQSSGIDLPLLKLGLAGEAVRFAQQRLIANAYPIKFNGQFGPQMKAAVEHFQRNYGGLDVDGVIGENTWRALCNGDAEFRRLGRSFYSPFVETRYRYDVNMPVLYEGHVGDAVECLQLRLSDIDFKLPYPLYIDGIFGLKTRQAVEAFQRLKGLKVDGVVGKETWRKLGE